MSVESVPRTFRSDTSPYETVEMGCLGEAHELELRFTKTENPGDSRRDGHENTWRWRIAVDGCHEYDWCNPRIDLFNLLDWLRDNRPDLLAERGIGVIV